MTVMKRQIMKMMKSTLPAMLLVLAGFQALAQPQPDPLVTTRFWNPVFDCPSRTYCVDVQFKSDTPGRQIFGVNVRLFYEDAILEYQSMDSFYEGYELWEDPEKTEDAASFGQYLGLAGADDWINGYVQLINPSDFALTTEFQTLFRICFHVDDPYSFNQADFCPTIIFDLTLNTVEDFGARAGFSYSEGWQVTLVPLPGSFNESDPSIEDVVQFNWAYDDPEGSPVGHPVPDFCIPNPCIIIPVSDWAIYLAIGLMIVATVFIYRRRISG
jgi:hypothetical protein